MLQYPKLLNWIQNYSMRLKSKSSYNNKFLKGFQVFQQYTLTKLSAGSKESLRFLDVPLFVTMESIHIQIQL